MGWPAGGGSRHEGGAQAGCRGLQGGGAQQGLLGLLDLLPRGREQPQVERAVVLVVVQGDPGEGLVVYGNGGGGGLLHWWMVAADGECGCWCLRKEQGKRGDAAVVWDWRDYQGD